MSSSSLAKFDGKKYKTLAKEITCAHVVQGRTEMKIPAYMSQGWEELENPETRVDRNSRWLQCWALTLTGLSVGRRALFRAKLLKCSKIHRNESNGWEKQTIFTITQQTEQAWRNLMAKSGCTYSYCKSGKIKPWCEVEQAQFQETAHLASTYKRIHGGIHCDHFLLFILFHRDCVW